MFNSSVHFLSRVFLVCVFAVYAVVALLSYFDYIEEYLYPLRYLQGTVQVVNQQITIGPYPRYDDLEKLKRGAGIQVIISLLNDKLPQEKALLEREKRVAKDLGLELYSFPMSYFDLHGKTNKKRANDLADLIRGMKGDQKIYIHCYLGRHRVQYMKDQLLQAGILTEVHR